MTFRLAPGGGWVDTADGIARTGPGGRFWSPAAGGTVHEVALAIAANHALAFSAAGDVWLRLDGGIWRRLDGGAWLRQQPAGPQTLETNVGLAAVAQLSTAPLFVYESGVVFAVATLDGIASTSDAEREAAIALASQNQIALASTVAGLDEAALTLGAFAGIEPAASVVFEAGVAVATLSQMSDTGTGEMGALLSMASAYAFSNAGGGTKNLGMVLSAAPGLASASMVVSTPAISIAIDTSAAAAALSTVEGALGVAVQFGSLVITTGSAVEAAMTLAAAFGGQAFIDPTIEAAVTLAASAGLSHQAMATLFAQIQLAHANGQSIAAIATVDADAALAHQLGVDALGSQAFEGAMTLATTLLQSTDSTVSPTVVVTAAPGRTIIIL